MVPPVLRVLAYSLNKGGPLMEPCGTPKVKNLTEEYSSLMLTLKPLPARYDLNQPNAVPLTPKIVLQNTDKNTMIHTVKSHC